MSSSLPIVLPARGHAHVALSRCQRSASPPCTYKGNLPMAQLLIVEDDRITALALQRAMTRLGHTVVGGGRAPTRPPRRWRRCTPTSLMWSSWILASVGGRMASWWARISKSSGRFPSFISPARTPPRLACLMVLTRSGARSPNRLTWITSATSSPNSSRVSHATHTRPCRVWRTRRIPSATLPRSFENSSGNGVSQ
jgi:hypothetical protein